MDDGRPSDAATAISTSAGAQVKEPSRGFALFEYGFPVFSDPTRPTHILTELGVGYRLQLPLEQRALIT